MVIRINISNKNVYICTNYEINNDTHPPPPARHIVAREISKRWNEMKKAKFNYWPKMSFIVNEFDDFFNFENKV